MSHGIIDMDREALLALRVTTNFREDNPSWGSSSSPHCWAPGIEVNAKGRLVQLRRTNGSITGSIPPSFGTLAALQELYLFHNQLTGAIPPEIGNLKALLRLFLYNNQLSGSIPRELSDLVALQSLDLSNNQLTGQIPPELGSLGNLRRLQLRHNQLMGSIPAELGNLSVLEWLDVSNNQLTGSIPAELGGLKALRQLSAGHNKLSGSIPGELGNLRELQSFYSHFNNLSALHQLAKQLTNSRSINSDLVPRFIPPELGKLKCLQRLFLQNNQLTGRIPSELGNLKGLLWLCLYNNRLVGAIPPELGGLPELRRLYLFNNQLGGDFPRELCELPALELVRVRCGNAMGGAPPDMYDKASISRWMQTYKSRAHRQPSPWALTAMKEMVSGWHFLVPVIDDITDILLLFQTYNGDQPELWWACVFALLVASVDRLYVLLQLALMVLVGIYFGLVTIVAYMLPFPNGCLDQHFEDVFEPLNLLSCGQILDPSSSRIGWLFLDGLSWVLVGSRARTSDFLSSLSPTAGDAPSHVPPGTSLGLQVIDVFVHHHPFRYLGELLFLCPYGHRMAGHQPGDVMRRGGIMVRAVGETLVMDPLFLALSIATTCSKSGFSGVSVASSIFCVLELVSELQYYVISAVNFMEPAGTTVEISAPMNRQRSASSTSATGVSTDSTTFLV